MAFLGRPVPYCFIAFVSRNPKAIKKLFDSPPR